MAWSLIGTLPLLTGGGPAFQDAIKFRAVIAFADANAAPADVFSGGLRGTFADGPNDVPTDAVRAGFSGGGLADTSAAPTDGRSMLTRTWITTSTSSGTAPTNPTNAYGPNDGAVATIKGNGGVSPSTSTLTCTIPVASIPAGGTKVLKAWFQIALGTGDTGSVTFQNPGGVPASGTLGNVTGNTLSAPALATITTVGTSLTVTATNTGALLGGNGVTLDAACVETTGL